MDNIIFIANTSWNLYNFRLNIMEEMLKEGYCVYALAPKDKYSIRIERKGIKYISTTINRNSKNILSNLLLIIRLIIIYRKIKPQIVHQFTIKPVLFGTLAARFAGINRIVNSITGLGSAFSRNNILRFFLTTLYRYIFSTKYVQIIFQNPDDRRFFAENKIGNPEQYHLIYGSGVNTDLFYPKEKKKDNNPISFALFARMIMDKGISEFIEAAFFVNKIYPKTEFLLAGGVDPGSSSSFSLESLKKKIIGGNGAIKWLGHIDDVKNIMTEVDVIVLPSYYNEGVPLSLIEAASLELPMITTNTAGCREIVKSNWNGLLIPPNDVSALIDAMIWMMENPEARLAMGKNGRKLVLEKFDSRIVVRQTVNIYRV